MQANFYLDVRILPTGDDTDLQIEHIRNQIYAVLHGCFRHKPHTFALALARSSKGEVEAIQRIQEGREQPKARRRYPVYDILRIFAPMLADLQWLRQELQQHWKVRGYAEVKEVQQVLQTDAWQSFRRFRIPVEKHDRKLEYNQQQGIKSLHERRLEQAKLLPYLRVKSKSTDGQQFTVIVDVQQAEHAGDGLPDGYGLARASQPFALPHF